MSRTVRLLGAKATAAAFLLSALLAIVGSPAYASTAQTPRVVDDPSAPSGWRLAADPTAPATPEGRIINGTPINESLAPWSVFLVSDDPATKMEATCGGAILNATTIVTAAHCTNGVTMGASPSNRGLGAIAGLNDYNHPDANAQSITVASWRLHPQWKGDINASSGGDIAVLTLASPLDPAKPNWKPIALPPPSVPANGDPIPVPGNLVQAGYGDQDISGHADGTIHALNTTIADPEVCPFAQSAPTLCVATPTGTACHGDSGSALVSNAGAVPVIIGVVSGGAAGTCQVGGGNAYTSILAPENRAFIDGQAPTIAPRSTANFTILTTTSNGSLAPGVAITCGGGGWDGSPSIKWIVGNDAGAQLASGTGATFTYTVQPADVGHKLTCRSYATNAGGVGVSPRVPTYNAVVAAPASAATPGSNSATVGPLTVTGPQSARRGRSVKLRVIMNALPAGTTGVEIKISTKGKHAVHKTGRYRVKSGQTAGAVTMKLTLSRKTPTGTVPFKVTVKSLFGRKKLGTTLKATIKVKVKK